jgi:YidC/Oxa1 family membrane protein insertase
VDYGFFEFLAKPLLALLKLFHEFAGNFGIAIIIVTVLIKVLFYPLTRKSFTAMRDMQRMQPKLEALKKKYEKDKERLNKEMMALYRTEGINPLGGCLPMVLQIPVFFALYQVLLNSIELRHAPFLFWINDLSSPEDLYTLDVAGFGLPLRLLPLVMGVTMMMQQKMTPSSMDKAQQQIMMIMPVMFTFLFWGFPSGLVLYWLVNNVISIMQQWWMNRGAKPAA